MRHPYTALDLAAVRLCCSREDETFLWGDAVDRREPLAMVDLRPDDGYRAVLDTLPAAEAIAADACRATWPVLKAWLNTGRALAAYLTYNRITVLVPSLAAATVLSRALLDAHHGDHGPLTGLAS